MPTVRVEKGGFSMSFIMMPAPFGHRIRGWQGPISTRAVRVAVLLSVVAVLNVVDLAYTLFADRIGMLNEMNPIADTFLKANLRPSLVCFKILMLICGLGLIWKSRRSRLAVPACWVLVIAYAALGVVWYAWTQQAEANIYLTTYWIR